MVYVIGERMTKNRKSNLKTVLNNKMSFNKFITRTYVSQSSPLANFSAHVYTPLCNQQYASTAAVHPANSDTFTDFQDFSR